MRHGWLEIPGFQTGDRTLEEQMLALRPALAMCQGRTVLDLGCAEGLIGREFARAGAVEVVGVDSVAGHLAVAAEQCITYPAMRFQLADLNTAIQQLVFRCDIVLCLGIAHKLWDPGDCIRFAADSSTDLVLIRSGRGDLGKGILRGKHSGLTCDSHKTMSERGFFIERVVPGPENRPDEPVEYWRRM